MNSDAILRRVAEIAPGATKTRIGCGGMGLWCFYADVDGERRLVQFTASGIYPPARYDMWGEMPKGDGYLAAEIAKELKK